MPVKNTSYTVYSGTPLNWSPVEPATSGLLREVVNLKGVPFTTKLIGKYLFGTD